MLSSPRVRDAPDISTPPAKNAPRLLCKLECTCQCYYIAPCYFGELDIHKEKNRTPTSPCQTSGAPVIVIDRSKRDVRRGGHLPVRLISVALVYAVFLLCHLGLGVSWRTHLFYGTGDVQRTKQNYEVPVRHFSLSSVYKTCQKVIIYNC